METQNNLLNEFNEPAFEYAGAWQRFFNYVIDLVAFYILMVIVGVIFGVASVLTTQTGERMNPATMQLFLLFINLLIMFLYYFLLEAAKGKTLGKLITKTKVVTDDGGAITYKQAFVRTISRFVPFEFLSGFSGLRMWHDQWSKTMVIKDK